MYVCQYSCLLLMVRQEGSGSCVHYIHHVIVRNLSHVLVITILRQTHKNESESCLP